MPVHLDGQHQVTASSSHVFLWFHCTVAVDKLQVRCHQVAQCCQRVQVVCPKLWPLLLAENLAAFQLGLAVPQVPSHQRQVCHGLQSVGMILSQHQFLAVESCLEDFEGGFAVFQILVHTSKKIIVINVDL